MREFVGAKIHGIRVTDKSVNYNGSVTICRTLMQKAGIAPYERVSVVNLSNGARWDTYALPGPNGVFTLNGGGARLGEIGDGCVVMTWRREQIFSGAHVLFCDQSNQIRQEMEYA